MANDVAIFTQLAQKWDDSVSYLRRPVEWCADKPKHYLHEMQRKVAESVRDNRYTAVPSAHELGKSLVAADLIAWWIDSHPVGQAMVISTAPSFHQVAAILWREIGRTHKAAQLEGKINRSPTPQWVLGNEPVGFGRKPADHEESAFQGMHNRYVLVVIDEACHDDQTEVLTEHGWRLFEELNGTERLLTMDPATHEARYTLPTKIIKKRYVGKMHVYDAKGGNFAVTPNHEMLWRTANSVWRKGEIQTWRSKTDRYMKKTIQWHDEPGDDDWAELLGWYFSEGSIGFGRGKPIYVMISQKNVVNTDLIEACVQRLGLPYTRYGDGIRIRSSDLARHFLSWGRGALVKTIPDEIMQAGVTTINRFLDSFELGDGYRKGKGGILYTSNERLAGQLQELCLKTGVPSVVRERGMADSTLRDGRVIPGSLGYVVTRPHKSTDMKIRAGAVQEVDYDGMVYCASVPPDALLFTRRGGYTMWSGNCGVDKRLYDAIRSIVANEHSRVLAIGNPDDPGSHFKEVCEPGSIWNVIRLDALRSPNFSEAQIVGDDPDSPRYPLTKALMEAEGIPYSTEKVSVELSENLCGPLYCEESLVDWCGVPKDAAQTMEWDDLKQLIRNRTADSPLFTSKVRGQFPSATSTGVIPLGWVEAAMNRWQDWKDSGGDPAKVPNPTRRVVGVDVAYGGMDETVVAVRFGSAITELHRYRNADTRETAAEAAVHLHETGTIVVVDVIGIGAGVFDTLRAWRKSNKHLADVIPFNAAANSSRKDAIGQFKFRNDRAAAWWNMRQLLDPSRGSTIMLPNDARLKQELVAVKYKHLAGGIIQIESKDDIKKRLGRSTDSADSVIQAFWVDGLEHRELPRTDGRSGYEYEIDGANEYSYENAASFAETDVAYTRPGVTSGRRPLVRAGGSSIPALAGVGDDDGVGW